MKNKNLQSALIFLKYYHLYGNVCVSGYVPCMWVCICVCVGQLKSCNNIAIHKEREIEKETQGHRDTEPETETVAIVVASGQTPSKW